MSENKQYYRWLSKYLPSQSDRRLVVLTGARQTGKTTLIRYAYPELNYINLDSPENRSAVNNTGSADWAQDIGAAVLDEAQKVPSIFEKVKYAYDAGALKFSVLLGSAQIMLLHQVRESLAGRVFLYELWPLMACELLTPAGIPAPAAPLLEDLLTADSVETVLGSKPEILLAEEEAPRIKAENYLLRWGGMPELLHLEDEDKKQWLRSYEYTYLERDLADLARLKDLEPFRKLQKLAALRAARLLNYSELAKDAGISVDSARRYLEYLALSYQVVLLQPYHENLTSQVVKSPKLYFVDVGILRRLAGSSGEASGEVYENYAVAEIFKWIRTAQKDVEIYFYRTRSGLELDLLLKTEKGFIGIEIKSSRRLSSIDYRPMLALAARLGNKWLGGICLYRGQKLYKLADPGIWAVPSYRLFT